MPDIALRSVDELTPHEWSAWRAIRAATPSLDSPYFAPELIQALSTGRPACRVAVLRRRSEIVGFFPFETNNLGLGRPIGGRLSDYHGPILPDGERIDAVDLVRRSGLISFAFEHIPATRTEFADHAQTTRPSHSLDVSHGFEAYRQERRAAKSDAGDDLRGAVKRVISRIGEPRFEWHTDSHTVFDQLVEWKQKQYAATGHTDPLASGWIRTALQRLAHTSTPEFAGVLSALWVGERLIAAHFGLWSGRVLHSWFPAYDDEFARVSPGSALNRCLIDAAHERGIDRIELGTGDEEYKQRLSNLQRPVLSGHVDTEPALTLARDTVQRTREWIRQSRFEAAAARPITAFRKLREAWSLR